MVARAGPLALSSREPGQARKGAAVAVQAGAGVWLVRVAAPMDPPLPLPSMATSCMQGAVPTYLHHPRTALATTETRRCPIKPWPASGARAHLRIW